MYINNLCSFPKSTKYSYKIINTHPSLTQNHVQKLYSPGKHFYQKSVFKVLKPLSCSFSKVLFLRLVVVFIPMATFWSIKYLAYWCSVHDLECGSYHHSQLNILSNFPYGNWLIIKLNDLIYPFLYKKECSVRYMNPFIAN